MNKKIKKQWISALRSGKYKQGQKKLCYGNQNGTRYCCLGVLSLLAVENGVCSRRTAFAKNESLTPSVSTWSGIQTNEPQIVYNGGNRYLTSLNDDEKLSFNELADLIEKQL